MEVFQASSRTERRELQASTFLCLQWAVAAFGTSDLATGDKECMTLCCNSWGKGGAYAGRLRKEISSTYTPSWQALGIVLLKLVFFGWAKPVEIGGGDPGESAAPRLR